MLDILKRVVSFPLAALLVAYDAFAALFGPILRPALARLASLELFVRIARAIAAAPPYAVLALLVVPFVLIEPFKVVGLYWIAQGRFVAGLATLVVAYLLNFFVCERIFQAGKAQLLSIGWFVRSYRFVVGLRDTALAWIRATSGWQAGAALAARVRARLARRLSA